MLSNLLMLIPVKTMLESGDCSSYRFSPDFFKEFNQEPILALENEDEREKIHPINRYLHELTVVLIDTITCKLWPFSQIFCCPWPRNVGTVWISNNTVTDVNKYPTLISHLLHLPIVRVHELLWVEGVSTRLQTVEQRHLQKFVLDNTHRRSHSWTVNIDLQLIPRLSRLHLRGLSRLLQSPFPVLVASPNS